jgi:hypothetical protein
VVKDRSEVATLAMSITMDRCSTDDHGHHLAGLRRPEVSSLYAWERDGSSRGKSDKSGHMLGCLDDPSKLARSLFGARAV